MDSQEAENPRLIEHGVSHKISALYGALSRYRKEPAVDVSIAFSLQIVMSLHLYYKVIESSISINGSKVEVIRTEIPSTAISLQIVDSYWLGGEPNNLATAEGEEEDCTEYSNLAAKNEHAAFSNMPSGPLGRANDGLCSVSHNFLCKNVQDKDRPKWAVSTVVAPFFSYATACPVGYRFALPMGDIESREVNALIDQRTDPFKLWVPLHDTEKEGEFRVIL